MMYARLLIYTQCILLWSTISEGGVRTGNRLPLPFAPAALSRTNPATLVPRNSQSLLVPPSTVSTVIFQEEFDDASGFPPPGWKSVNADDGGTTGPWFQGNDAIFYPYSGAGYAAANYQGANDFYIDEWLITPMIWSVSGSDTLQFWHRSPDFSAWDDSLEIRISTTDTSLSAFSLILGYFKTSTNGWSKIQFPLHGLVPDGSNIFVAFRYLLYNGGISGLSSDYAGIDLVQVIRPQVARDVQVKSIDYPFNESKIPRGSAIGPVVSFQNVGTGPEVNIPVKVRIVFPSGIVHEQSDTVASLMTGGTEQFEFDDFIADECGAYRLTAYSYLPADQNGSNDSLSVRFRGAILISGSFTVGAGGDFSSISDAFDTLNNNILSGDVTLSLISASYDEPPLLLGPLEYASSPNRITLKTGQYVSSSVNIVSTQDKPFGIAIRGASRVTIDGSGGTFSDRRISLNAGGSDGKIGIMVGGINGAYADSNLIKNLVIRTGVDSMSSSAGSYGVLFYGNDALFPDAGNKISNCDISRHGSAGIGVQWQSGAVIQENQIRDWIQRGGDNDVHGVWIADGATGSVVTGNVIGNIGTNVNYCWSYGIENGAGQNSNAGIFNNMIYNVFSSGSGTEANFSRGIYGSSTINSNDKYCYNSIYLSGHDSSANPASRTAVIEIAGGSNIEILNNIFYNNSTLASSSESNKAYGIYISAEPENFVSDHNDIYAPGVQGSAGFNGSNQILLSDWMNSFYPRVDSSSLSCDPLFVSPSSGDLHISTGAPSPVDAGGVPVTCVTTDIDRNYRNETTPDIGADEFIPGGMAVQTEYQPGWNLISVPVVPEDFRRSVLFPSASSAAFLFDAGYTMSDTLENGRGYWLKFDLPQQIGFAGSGILSDTADLKPGWNIVGSVSDSVVVTDIIQLPAGNIISKFFKYESFYSEANILMPGRGYWVKAAAAGKIILRAL